MKDSHTVQLIWNNHCHVVVFSDDFTKYVSVRTHPNDLDICTGSIFQYIHISDKPNVHLSKINMYINHLTTSYENAENGVSRISPEIMEMDGMSGTKTRHFYNNLLQIDDARYLEVGTWKGSSVCAAMCGNSATVVCIDNWCQFNGPKEEFIRNFNMFKGLNTAIYIESDCFQLDITRLPKFNIYMYDGEHSLQSHYNALIYYYDRMDDVFIYVVDDWNLSKVRDGTVAAIKKLNLQILFEKQIILTTDDMITPQPLASETWWNGIYFAVLQKV